MIIGIDVGISTGFALYNESSDSIVMTSVTTLEDLEWTLLYYLSVAPDAKVVVEYPIPVGISTKEIKNILHTAARIINQHSTPWAVTPAQWKNTIFSKWYNRTQSPPRGTTQHEKDAANIAKYWYERNKREQFRSKLDG